MANDQNEKTTEGDEKKNIVYSNYEECFGRCWEEEKKESIMVNKHEGVKCFSSLSSTFLQ